MVEVFWRRSSSRAPPVRKTSALRVTRMIALWLMVSFLSSSGRKWRTSCSVRTIFWRPSISKLRYAGTRWSGIMASFCSDPRPRKAMMLLSSPQMKGSAWSAGMIFGKRSSRISPNSFLDISSSTLEIFLKSSTSTPFARSSSRIAFQMLSTRACCSRVTRSTSVICWSGSIPERGSFLSGVSMARCVRMPMRTR